MPAADAALIPSAVGYIVSSFRRTLPSAKRQSSFTRRIFAMSNACTNGGCACTPNQSIKCTVNNCAHHCQDQNYCGLTSITVGTHETNPTEIKCTDCQSFELK